MQSLIVLFCFGLSEKNEEKCAIFAGFLDGMAYEKYSELTKEVKNDWKSLLPALRAELVEREKTIYRQQFTEAIQLEHEDFSTLVTRLRKLARFGYSDESPAMVQMRVEDKGIQSYRDMLIRQFLLENEGKP